LAYARLVWGNLAIICKAKEERFIELWIIENYDWKIWKKKQIVNSEALKKKNRNIWSTSLTTLGHHSLTPSHQQPNQTQHVIK
jgi:hypothetical protein